MWFFYGISQLFHVIRKLLSIIFNLSMQNLYQSKLRHWWSENMNTCAHMMATVMSFQDPLGRWDSPCPSCWLGLLTASGQVSHSQPHRTPDLRLYPLLPEQQLASRNLSVWRGVQAPGPLSANWDNPEDPSSFRATYIAGHMTPFSIFKTSKRASSSAFLSVALLPWSLCLLYLWPSHLPLRRNLVITSGPPR